MTPDSSGLADDADFAISVCLCTYQRPTRLLPLLRALANQRDLRGRYEVVVVDNDRDRSARSVLRDARRDLPSLPLICAVEPRQNIALARNLTVALARGRLLAFIDDDELPDERWLASLEETLSRHHADGVFGPVVSRLPDDVAVFITRGRFFDRPRHATGSLMPRDQLRTGNAMVRRALLDPGSASRARSANSTRGSPAHARQIRKQR